MSIQNMHYDFKQKLNKIDSQKYRTLRVQEIDWKLNEALGIYIKTIAQPRIDRNLGFEGNERSIEDIRDLVSEGVESIPTPFGDSKSFIAALPSEYWFLVSSKALGTKGSCTNVALETVEVQHNDRHEESAFDASSFEWRNVNFRKYQGGLRIFTDGSFTITKFIIDFIRKPLYMHYATGAGGSYKMPNGTVLTGKQDCEITNEIIQREIVDLAVLITTGDLQVGDYQVKAAKVKLND